ncbi:MAG: squalene/phytoene synthase family protein [Verrucomicrobiales bacterium]
METSREIVRRSGSNLAFALAVLPRDKRDDMEVFYAFCRLADDIADDPDLSLAQKHAGLNRWRQLIRGGIDQPRPGVETEFLELCDRRSLDAEELDAIVIGVEMDLEPVRFETAEELKHYCFHVAGSVGLASIRIFGHEDPATRLYAEQLGYALQWTNILRDIGEDAAEKRLYLPLEDLRRFGLKEDHILSGAPDPASFQRLMKYETRMARQFYADAVAALPAVDRGSMRSAELMRRIYFGILREMESDGFRVFDKRYRLPKARMVCEVLRTKLAG